jgi:hypothetical protein
MSNKDRQKKDHERTDKKHNENPREQRAEPRHQARDESNLTDTELGPERRER